VESYSITEGSTKAPGFFLLPVESEIPGVYLSRKSDLVILRLDLACQMIVRPGQGRLSSDWRSHARVRKLLIVVHGRPIM